MALESSGKSRMKLTVTDQRTGEIQVIEPKAINPTKSLGQETYETVMGWVGGSRPWKDLTPDEKIRWEYSAEKAEQEMK